MIDIAHVRRELLARRFKLGDAPEGPAGVYAFFLDDPTLLAPLVLAANGPLYVGMTSPERRENARDHIECAHSGGSSPRRSLGALLKDKLRPPLKALPRAPRKDPKNWQNYRFQDEGEAALTVWMKSHLQMNFVALTATPKEILECEEALIRDLVPPLNLTNWPNPHAAEIKRLRSLCAQEARGMTPTDPRPRRPKKIDVSPAGPQRGRGARAARRLGRSSSPARSSRAASRSTMVRTPPVERARVALKVIELLREALDDLFDKYRR
jgi:hypothetical protein